jgi:hypothetical protein
LPEARNAIPHGNHYNKSRNNLGATGDIGHKLIPYF